LAIAASAGVELEQAASGRVTVADRHAAVTTDSASTASRSSLNGRPTRAFLPSAISAPPAAALLLLIFKSYYLPIKTVWNSVPKTKAVTRIYFRGCWGHRRRKGSPVSGWRGTMASAEHERIMGVWGQSPQRGPGAEPLVRGQRGEAPPLKLKAFWSLDVQRSRQIKPL